MALRLGGLICIEGGFGDCHECGKAPVNLRGVKARRGVDVHLRSVVGFHEAVDLDDERLRHFPRVGYGRVGDRFPFGGERLVGCRERRIVGPVGGGVIGREAGSNEPDGLLFETAFLPIFAEVPGPDDDETLRLLEKGQDLYLQAGITTAQEGATMKHQLDLLRLLADRGSLKLDVVSLPFFTEIDAIFAGKPPADEPDYRNRLRIGGVKIVTDGSPQGRTAAFTTPYLTEGPAGQKSWRGELSFPQSVFNDTVKKVYDGGATLFVHCNGDAAIDALLEAHRFASEGDPTKPRGTVGIHSQFIRRDQLQKYAAWQITPSFYTEHCFYFGDTHVVNRGREQAEFISPMKSALALGLHPANHTDFNVAPLDQLFTIHTAVNRQTRSGVILGEAERVTPLEALRAITLDGARMYGEEDKKGSIETGKLADLVILSADPTAVPAAEIEKIEVLETIKEGKTVWKK